MIGALVAFLVFVAWWLYERTQRRTYAMSPGLHPDIDLPHSQEWEIYQNQISLCSKKLRVCMEELELPHASHPIDLVETGSYENLGRAFLKINPGFTVPVLVHRGHPVYESHEQIVYAAENAGPKGAELLGQTARERAEVARWVDFGALKGDPMKGGADRAGDSAPGLTIPIFATMIAYIPWRKLFEGLLFHGDRKRPLLFMMMKLRGIKGLPPPALRIIARSRKNMGKHLDALEETLGDGRPWVCGQAFTLGDVSWMAIFERLNEVDWIDLFLGEGRRPRVAAYLERMRARPSYEIALAPRGEVHVQALRDLSEAKASSPALREALEGR